MVRRIVRGRCDRTGKCKESVIHRDDVRACRENIWVVVSDAGCVVVAYLPAVVVVTAEFEPVGVADVFDRFDTLTGYVDREDSVFCGDRCLLGARDKPVRTNDAECQDNHRREDFDDGEGALETEVMRVVRCLGGCHAEEEISR